MPLNSEERLTQVCEEQVQPTWLMDTFIVWNSAAKEHQGQATLSSLGPDLQAEHQAALQPHGSRTILECPALHGKRWTLNELKTSLPTLQTPRPNPTFRKCEPEPTAETQTRDQLSSPADIPRDYSCDQSVLRLSRVGGGRRHSQCDLFRGLYRVIRSIISVS